LVHAHGGEGDAVLVVLDFLRDADPHGVSNLSFLVLGCQADGSGQSRSVARDSTSRSFCSISSKCCWSQISGGASWTTGSPRSSARQYSPASNSALDRNPRSSRSDSSSSKVSLVALSLTSSMP